MLTALVFVSLAVSLAATLVGGEVDQARRIRNLETLKSGTLR